MYVKAMVFTVEYQSSIGASVEENSSLRCSSKVLLPASSPRQSTGA